MAHLYELSTELATINDEIISADGELTPDLEARLDSVSLDFRAKSQGIAKWTLDIAGVEAMIETEIARLQRKKKVAENLRTRLMAYIKGCMEQADVQKIESPTIHAPHPEEPAERGDPRGGPAPRQVHSHQADHGTRQDRHARCPQERRGRAGCPARHGENPSPHQIGGIDWNRKRSGSST